MGLSKPVILIIGIAQLLWGLLPLLAPETALSIYGEQTTGLEEWVRMIGAIMAVWGVMIIFASFDPQRHKMIITFSIILYLCVDVLFLMMVFVLNEVPADNLVWWTDFGITGVFLVLLLIFYPRKQTSA